MRCRTDRGIINELDLRTNRDSNYPHGIINYDLLTWLIADEVMAPRVCPHVQALIFFVFFINLIINIFIIYLFVLIGL